MSKFPSFHSEFANKLFPWVRFLESWKSVANMAALRSAVLSDLQLWNLLLHDCWVKYSLLYGALLLLACFTRLERTILVFQHRKLGKPSVGLISYSSLQSKWNTAIFHIHEHKQQKHLDANESKDKFMLTGHCTEDVTVLVLWGTQGPGVYVDVFWAIKLIHTPWRQHALRASMDRDVTSAWSCFVTFLRSCWIVSCGGGEFSLQRDDDFDPWWLFTSQSNICSHTVNRLVAQWTFWHVRKPTDGLIMSAFHVERWSCSYRCAVSFTGTLNGIELLLL